MRSEARLALYVTLILVVAACSGDQGAITTTSASVPSSPTVTETTAPPTTTTTMVETTTTLVGSSDRWETGDCLRFDNLEDLPYEPFGSDPLTSCDEAHTHEMFHTGSFPGAENAAYPEGSINSQISDTCIETFIDLVGFLPVQTELDIVMYLPDPDEWASGLRYQGCLVYLPAGLNRFRDLIGSVADRGGDFMLDVSSGDCFPTPDVKIPSVDCAQPHIGELVGTVSHPVEEGAPYPGVDQLQLFVVRECEALRGEYVVENERADTTVAFAPIFTEPEWASGWREFRCLAFALGPDGGIVPVTGSFADEGWTVVEGNQAA